MLVILSEETYGQDLGGFMNGRKYDKKEKVAKWAVLLATKANILEVKYHTELMRVVKEK